MGSSWSSPSKVNSRDEYSLACNYHFSTILFWFCFDFYWFCGGALFLMQVMTQVESHGRCWVRGGELFMVLAWR